MTRGEAISTRYRKLVTTIYPRLGPSQATTTFTLYRRQFLAGEDRNDLGLQVRPTIQDFEVEEIDQPCVFYGVKRADGRWVVLPEGQYQTEYVMLWTAVDVHEGDNVRLAYDGKTYLVESTSYVDSVRQCLLNSTKAQIT